MLREDYILAWIKRYVQWLLEIVGAVKAEDHLAAARRIDQLLRLLLDVGPDSVTRLTDGEILARLALGDPPALVQERCVVIAVALQQLGLICAAQGQTDASRDCLVKALHLALGLRLRGAGALAEHAPGVDTLLDQLRPHALPPHTYAALMLFHEQERRYGRAEDALFALLDALPDEADPLEMGLGLYRRLAALSDELLAAGGLPRPEVEEGRRELEARLARLRRPPSPAGAA